MKERIIIDDYEFDILKRYRYADRNGENEDPELDESGAKIAAYCKVSWKLIVDVKKLPEQ